LVFCLLVANTHTHIQQAHAHTHSDRQHIFFSYTHTHKLIYRIYYEKKSYKKDLGHTREGNDKKLYKKPEDFRTFV